MPKVEAAEGEIIWFAPSNPRAKFQKWWILHFPDGVDNQGYLFQTGAPPHPEPEQRLLSYSLGGSSN